MNQDVYLAFYNNTEDGYILQIDDFEVYEDFASVSENETDLISIYPNPANETLNLNIDNNGDFTVRILSMDGSTLITSSSKSVDVSELSKGTYIIVYQDDTNTISKQFIKL